MENNSLEGVLTVTFCIGKCRYCKSACQYLRVTGTVFGTVDMHVFVF